MAVRTEGQLLGRVGCSRGRRDVGFPEQRRRTKLNAAVFVDQRDESIVAIHTRQVDMPRLRAYPTFRYLR